MKYFKKLFLFSSLFWVLGVMAPMGCGGGATSSSDQTLSDGATPTATEREMKDFDISIRLNEAGDPAALTLDDITYSDSIAAVSLFSQVTHVSIEVIISGSVFSTTELTRSTTDPLIYTGRISIPVDAEVELHAMATDGGHTLFEGRLRGLHAADYGTPAIQITLQRLIPVESTPPPNSHPIIFGTVVGDVSLAYSGSTTMSVDAQDPQGDTVNYLWEVISAPSGAPTTGLITHATERTATFTAPSVTGSYLIRVTTSDPAGAFAHTAVTVYVSETGLNGTPDSGITLSDFPDSVTLAEPSSIHYVSDMLLWSPLYLSFWNTLPHRIILDPVASYSVGSTTSYYSATQLQSMGFQFSWLDNCRGSNFISTDSAGNESFTNTSSSFVPVFVKRDLEEEACQINLTITNPEGMHQTYYNVFNFYNDGNSYSDEMDCDRDPSTARPKIHLTCPTNMTTTPQVVRVDVCDAQGDLYSLRSTASAATLSTSTNVMWRLQRDSAGRVKYIKDIMYGYTRFDLSGTNSSATFLLFPYSAAALPDQLSHVGANAIISPTFLNRSDLVQPIAMQVGFTVEDRDGNQSFARCAISIDPSIDLNVPADYFTR